MKRITVTALVVVLLLALAGGGVVAVRSLRDPSGVPPQQAAFEPSEAVQIVESREVTWQPTADLVGTVVAIRSVMVRNELAGVVRHVGFDSGSVLEPGQVVLRQDETLERADLEAARASVRVAEANLAQVEAQIRLAEQELERLTRGGSRAVAEVEIDRARSKLETAAADRMRWGAEVDQAKARVDQVSTRLAKLTIAAPFRARAGMRTVHEGQYLAEGADVVMLQELTDRIYLDFAIPQENAPRVVPGTAVMATGALLGPDPVRIEVVAVDAAVNNETRNLRVRAVVDNPTGVLVPGMFVQVRVPTDAPVSRVAIPSTAVRRAPYGASVFVVGKDEKDGSMRARQRFVTLGPAVGNDVIVLEGLRSGERLAAAGSFKLRDGARVAEGPPAPPPGIAANSSAGADREVH